MKEQLIQEVQRQMLPYLNNAQLKQLQAVLEKALTGVTVHRDEVPDVSESVDTVSLFITAKRIEGCSEKTLNYYRQTIFAMLSGIGKLAQEITTEDLRMYLTDYQGLLRFYAQNLRHGTDPDDLLCFVINIYSESKIYNEFSLLSDQSKLKKFICIYRKLNR